MTRRGGAMIWIIVGLAIVGSAAMLAVVVLVQGGGKKPVDAPGITGGSVSQEAGPNVKEAIEALPTLAEIRADGSTGELLFHQTGKPRQLESRPWARGGHIVRYAVDVETRPTVAAAWSSGEAIIEVTLDERGQTVSMQTLTIKGADELELERAAGVR